MRIDRANQYYADREGVELPGSHLRWVGPVQSHTFFYRAQAGVYYQSGLKLLLEIEFQTEPGLQKYGKPNP